MKVLRTAEERFAALPGFAYEPRYADVGGLRLAYVEDGLWLRLAQASQRDGGDVEVVVAQGGLGQYYDLEGTTWQNAPILRSPDQTVRVAGRTMQLYFEGQRLRLVAWHDGPAVYWLVNTLSNVLSNRQMLAIAGAAKRS